MFLVKGKITLSTAEDAAQIARQIQRASSAGLAPTLDQPTRHRSLGQALFARLGFEPGDGGSWQS